MMFQYCSMTKIAQRAAEHGSILFNDAGERNDEDHSAQAVLDSVVQREGERGQRFTAAGGYSQREKSRQMESFASHMAQYFLANAIDFPLDRQCRQKDIKLGFKHF